MSKSSAAVKEDRVLMRANVIYRSDEVMSGSNVITVHNSPTRRVMIGGECRLSISLVLFRGDSISDVIDVII